MFNPSSELMWLIFSSLLFYLGPGTVAGIVWYWRNVRAEHNVEWNSKNIPWILPLSDLKQQA